MTEDDSARPDAEADKSLKFQLTDLIDDARKLAIAEVEYYRTKLSVNLTATKQVLMLFGIAMVVGIMTLVALILGILLILSHYLGPIAATGLLTGSTLLIALVLMNIAIKRARKLPLDEND
ncbi:phage holin family protein [Parasphingorhabdus sp.]|uniref:phage holin family protein n=1 Tax=Parasphingorhabdus sp. TaxID=2709688 RepID=UPI00137352F9